MMTNTPLTRFDAIVSSWSGTNPSGVAPTANGQSIQQVARAAAANASEGRKVSAAADEVADKFAPETNFTRAALIKAFTDAANQNTAAATDDQKVDAAAESVAKKVTELAMPSLSAELTGANMLHDGWRIGGAILFAVLLIGIGITTYFLTNGYPNLTGGFFAFASTASFLFVVAILVLIMGYGSVKLGTSVKDTESGSNQSEGSNTGAGGGTDGNPTGR